MAANITITSPSLASDGKTLTATLSGGSAPYSLSTGTTLTGLTIKSAFGGVTNIVSTDSSVATNISGATITIVVEATVPSGAVVTFDISSGSNLRDSSANTATGQTAVSVSNGSSKV